MAELRDRVRSAGSHVTAAWTPARASEVLAQVQVTRVQRRRRRAAGVMLAMVILLTGALLGSRRMAPAPVLSQTAVRTERGLLQLSDGSLASALDEQSQLELLTTQPDRVLIRLDVYKRQIQASASCDPVAATCGSMASDAQT